MEKTIGLGLCTICHKSFCYGTKGNKMMCPKCRVQDKGSNKARSTTTHFVIAHEKKIRRAG